MDTNHHITYDNSLYLTIKNKKHSSYYLIMQQSNDLFLITHPNSFIGHTTNPYVALHRNGHKGNLSKVANLLCNITIDKDSI